MESKRKIVKKIRKVSFSEAEKVDDEFWKKSSEAERLNELESLRKIFWPNATGRMKKVVKKRYLYEEEK